MYRVLMTGVLIWILDRGWDWKKLGLFRNDLLQDCSWLHDIHVTSDVYTFMIRPMVFIGLDLEGKR